MTRRRLLVLVALIALSAALAWITPKVLRRLDNQGFRPVTIASGLDHPWSLQFLPDGRMLISERAGRLRLVTATGEIGPPLSGVPAVWAQGEGGLLDVALDPEFRKNALVYWTYAEPDPARPQYSSTAVAKGRLEAHTLKDVQVIWRQPEKVESPVHFGSRILFAPDGSMFVGLGDRSRRADSQAPASAHGKLIRISRDGQAAVGNPYVGDNTALPEVWSLGHRNIQGLAFHPQTGELWAGEHGPQGGDELNVIRKGANYGWPVITYGCEYDTCAKIGEGTHHEGMEQPVVHWWEPGSNAPSGMAFLTSSRYPGWENQLFIAELRGSDIRRIRLDGHRVVEQQKMLTGLSTRFRDVKQGPDGWLYALTDSSDGRILRLER